MRRDSDTLCKAQGRKRCVSVRGSNPLTRREVVGGDSGATRRHMPACHSSGGSTAVSETPSDCVAYRRAAAAYQGLNRTDPHAVWSYQGWAILKWRSQEQRARFKAVVAAVPEGKFNVIDMDTNGAGQWKNWGNYSFFGARSHLRFRCRLLV